MPHNPSLISKKHAYKILLGQKPLTRFQDYRKSIQVDLIKYDDKKSMLKGIYDFVKASWSEDGLDSIRATEDQMQEALEAMLSGKTLSLGLETINLMFRISGISRIDTHQIVRQRVGVTFSQQCTGDRFLNHNNVLVEECIAEQSDILEEFIEATLLAKNNYAKMVDRNISIQVAREIMPHNLETFIYLNTNVQTLLFFYHKRVEDGSQTWQMNEISRQMAEEVCRVYPEMKPVFEKHKKTFTLQKDQSADRKNQFSSSLYVPKDDEFEYHIRDFLYDKTKEQAVFTNTSIDYRYFWGYREITEYQYSKIKKMYSELDSSITNNNFTNAEILKLAQDLNYSITSNWQNL